MPRPTRDLKGMKFGKLEVLEFGGYKKRGKSSIATWICRCDCGTEKVINAVDLIQGKTKSCGCLKNDGSSRIINMVGQKFGRLTVIEMIKKDGEKTSCRCICDCGNETIANSWQIRNGFTKSCGCLKNEQGNHVEDLKGRRFGKLMALEFAGITNKKTLWRCQCDCGNEVIAYATNLKSGHASSCGCLKYPAKKLSNTRIYHIYRGMISRCYKETDGNYAIYGGRGITVCDEWLGEDGLFNFKEWADNNGYQNDLTIDRIDTNGNYEPSNCRWATLIEQANNKRNNIMLTYNGKTKTIPEWSRELGVNRGLLYSRKKLGWTDKQCIETKVGEKRK